MGSTHTIQYHSILGTFGDTWVSGLAVTEKIKLAHISSRIYHKIIDLDAILGGIVEFLGIIRRIGDAVVEFV